MQGNTQMLHIVPHTHWDREWYMSFERHRYRFVRLMDTLLAFLDSHPDEEYHFHMDGQVVIINDYLEVRPQNREKVTRYIREGKIKIGPFYILQDEFLISAEANVRNVLYGLKECRKYTDSPSMIGYFPDAFGNISQMPQILRGFGIDAAAFGRGIGAIAADNSLTDSGYVPSEVIWESPDGSSVLGIVFAGWYNNGSEIPREPQKAAEFLRQKARLAEASAATDQLLLMNGSDHQPVQTDLTDILQDVRGLIPYEVKVSSLEEYAAAVRSACDRFPHYRGELISADTDGWWTLVNTCSARLYIKRLNYDAQRMLWGIAEPLSAMAYLENRTDSSDILYHAWKFLAQNQPHDSICSCNADPVSADMVRRFHHCIDVCDILTWDLLRELGKEAPAASDPMKKAVMLFNTSLQPVTERVTFTVDFEEEAADPQKIVVTDNNGQVLPSDAVYLGRKFRFELPDDSFRKADTVHRFQIDIHTSLPPMGYRTVSVSYGGRNADESPFTLTDRELSNGKVRVVFAEDGTFSLYDLASGAAFHGLNAMEDCGDIGDEYTFRETDTPRITVPSAVELRPLLCGRASAAMQVVRRYSIPVSADRGTKTRSRETTELVVTSEVRLMPDDSRVLIRTSFDNQAENHRLRALFPSGLQTGECLADAQFDVVHRPIAVGSRWQNPSNCQHQSDFVAVSDGKYGLLAANRGLPEYELLPQDNTIALTLLRAIDQIGDWGYFPTPDAQCKGPFTAEYMVTAFAAEQWYDVIRQAHDFAGAPVMGKQLHQKDAGWKDGERSYLSLEAPGVFCTAVKKAEQEGIVTRVYSVNDAPVVCRMKLDPRFTRAALCNMKEEVLQPLPLSGGTVTFEIRPGQIVTLRLTV